MKYSLLFCLLILAGCKSSEKNQQITATENVVESKGFTVEILDDAVRSILTEDANITTIAAGFTWAEGTLWLPDQQALIFSDVPENKIYKWIPNQGLSTWMDSSGYTGPAEIKREGSNGLLLNELGQLVICQHGDRRVVVMDATLSNPKPKYTTLASTWRKNRLNSPNDAAYYKGELYFTDPPYGLFGQDKDPLKEIGFNGVYRVGKKGVVIKIVDNLKRPNGIAFNSETNMMYVSNSDPEHAIWMRYDMSDVNNPQGYLLYDATDQVSRFSGLPDGLKIHPSGYVFATGPGGIWVFSPTDKLSARIYVPQATANCAFDDTYSNLYVAADSTVIRVALKAPPAKSNPN
ncbi:MAG: SMP-30/gluconolactonase/LRE family protein [Bacteroidota bacterium]|nr:SMP-30/gluconolactonase/LRE family protein [Bacteroidota bacterium]